ncbi:Alpha/Beta hydrolase protein [Lineolata rhizophorae]|uniref:Alpha/Beta hydrolase protein n=1 Tax=Lineolata rhizophorae TaxID=578093 RepID=A0A6A6NQ47_9PEZI|nr:Alpha/Beta hydrolase protein [Lineolata rhizophorae]
MPKEVLPWLVFPPTPKLDLSKALQQGLVKNARGVRLWHAIFGVPLERSLRAGKAPVLLLHGGVSSSEWNAPQVEFLEKDYTVIVLDLPGHGRSPFDDRELTYPKVAGDIAGFLDALSIPKVSIVSWSEGTMMGWSLLAYGHHDRVERAFLYSALDDYRNADAERVMGIPMVGEFFARAQKEWEETHPRQSWDDFLGAWMTMWTREPIWTAETFKHLPVRGESKDAPIVWIVTGDHDDWIPPETHDRMATFIRNSSYLKMPSAGHLQFIQNIPAYNRFVQCFLEDTNVGDSPKASL